MKIINIIMKTKTLNPMKMQLILIMKINVKFLTLKTLMMKMMKIRIIKVLKQTKNIKLMMKCR